MDKAEAAGVREKLPMQKHEGTEPLVAVWIGSSLEVDKRDYVPDIKRFIMNEYQMMLPRYVIVDTETKRAKLFIVISLPSTVNTL